MKLSEFKTAISKLETEIFNQCWVSGKINEIPDPDISVADDIGNSEYEPILQLEKSETGFKIIL